VTSPDPEPMTGVTLVNKFPNVCSQSPEDLGTNCLKELAQVVEIYQSAKTSSAHTCEWFIGNVSD